MFSKTQSELIYSFLMAGFAHGIIEASIKPLCATMYKTQKSKMPNILHASWPAGIVVGAGACLLMGDSLPYRSAFIMPAIGAIIFGIGFLIAKKIPQDERIENNVSYLEMLREFGGLSIFLAVTFLFYEFANQAKLVGNDGQLISTARHLPISLIVGVLAGIIAAVTLKSMGKFLFFFLCLIMIPLATAEIATDGWIKKLMEPVLAADFSINSGWAIVLSAFIMMTLRFFAGVPLKVMSPLTLLLVSSLFSIAGLFLLSEVAGIMIFVAFVLYGIGQTFYWPTVLGFTSEQFPKGGAMTLNTVSAMGLLTVGIFGTPFLGVVADKYNSDIIKKEATGLYTAKNAEGKLSYGKPDESFFGFKYDSVNAEGLLVDDSLLTQKGKELKKIINSVPAKGSTKEQRETAAAAQVELNKLTTLQVNEKEGEKVKTDEGAALTKAVQNNGRKVLKVAALLPATMAVCFLILIIYFKMKGGYKPVILNEEDYQTANSGGG